MKTKKETEKHLGLRINAQIHSKLKYISDYEGRSINRQVLYLIRNCIYEFEKNHGEIKDTTSNK